LAQALDNIGAVYNAYTDKENTAYWIKTAPEFLPLSLEILSQMWLKAIIREEEIKTERGVIIEELNMYQDQPRDKVDDLFEEQIFGKNPLGRPIIGKKETILKIGKKNFLDFKKSFYKTSNMALVIAGQITEINRVKKAIKKFFYQGWQGGIEPDKITVAPKKEKTFWQKQKTQQTHFVLGFPGLAFGDQEKYQLKILAAVLAGSMSSRLWREVREKRGLAYYVFGFTQEYPSAGYLAIKAGVNNDRVKEAIKICQEELLKISRNLKPREVSLAKQVIRGRFLVSLEDPLTSTDLIGRNWLFSQEKVLPEEVLKKIEAVSFGQAVKAAEKFCRPEKIRLAAVGPKG